MRDKNATTAAGAGRSAPTAKRAGNSHSASDPQQQHPVASSGISASDKTPRTARGERTLRALIEAAIVEFGDHGFSDTSIVTITRRAGVALGSFYTYFDSKDAIFRAVVQDMSQRVRDHVAPSLQAADNALAAEQAALTAFLRFAREHKEIYRIIDESEFVDPDSFHTHYRNTVDRIEARLTAGAATGQFRRDIGETEAWAIMGMNVFLGLRYGVWAQDKSAEQVAAEANELLRRGIGVSG